jgi:glutathione S-transferase
MKLYMHPVSTTCRPVMTFVAENGIEVERQVVDLFTGEQYQPDFQAINPSSQVPVLEDGAFRLTESATILRYLAYKTGSPAYPQGREARVVRDVEEMAPLDPRRSGDVEGAAAVGDGEPAVERHAAPDRQLDGLNRLGTQALHRVAEDVAEFHSDSPRASVPSGRTVAASSRRSQRLRRVRCRVAHAGRNGDEGRISRPSDRVRPRTQVFAEPPSECCRSARAALRLAAASSRRCSFSFLFCSLARVRSVRCCR